MRAKAKAEEDDGILKQAKEVLKSAKLFMPYVKDKKTHNIFALFMLLPSSHDT